MEYTVVCIECLPPDLKHFTIKVSPNNEGVYEVTCPHGHQFKVDVLSHHFQVLFENGLAALNDNYYIEAISSFTATYERFLEYFIEIVLLSKKIDSSEFSKTWKLVSKQSERQIGAFIFIYLNEFGKQPVLLSQSNIELRNKVIHKGYFPTKDECIDYGNNVLEVIRSIIELLKGNKKYEIELHRSINSSRSFDSCEIRCHYVPYQIFAINRPINETDNYSVSDFLKEN